MQSIGRQSLYLLLGITVGAISLLVLMTAIDSGRYIPNNDLATDYAKGLLWGLIITLTLLILPLRETIKKAVVIIWLVRLFVALGPMLYYEYYYQLDAYDYFLTAVNGAKNFSLFDVAGTEFVYWLGSTLVRALPYTDSFHALKVIWGFFGLIGSYFFYIGYINWSRKESIPLLTILCMFPSLLFWTSTLGKDPICYLGIGIMFYALSSLNFEFSVKNISLLILGILIVFSIRFWLIPIFLFPPLIVLLTKSDQAIWRRGLALVIVGSLTFFATKKVEEKINIKGGPQLVSRINTISKAWSTGGSGLEIPVITNYRDAVAYLPTGIFTALFRPLPGEINNPFGILSGIENLILLFLFGTMISKLFVMKKIDWIMQYTLIVLVLWSLVYAFISPQNLGTAARFKIQVLPFLIIAYFHAKSSLQRE